MRKLYKFFSAALFAVFLAALAPQAAGAAPATPGGAAATRSAAPDLTEQVWHGGWHGRRVYRTYYGPRRVYRPYRAYRPVYYRPRAAYYRPCRLVRRTVWTGYGWRSVVVRRCR